MKPAHATNQSRSSGTLISLAIWFTTIPEGNGIRYDFVQVTIPQTQRSYKISPSVLAAVLSRRCPLIYSANTICYVILITCNVDDKGVCGFNRPIEAVLNHQSRPSRRMWQCPPGDAVATVMATSGHTDARVSVNSGAPGFPVRWAVHPIRCLRGAVYEKIG